MEMNKMKKIEQWLMQLPPGYRERALYNAKVEKLYLHKESLADAINDAFRWKDSPKDEGGIFWFRVHAWAMGLGELPPLPEKEDSFKYQYTATRDELKTPEMNYTGVIERRQEECKTEEGNETLKKGGVVEAVGIHSVKVRWGNGVGDVENLVGIAKPTDVEVGDFGVLYYTKSPNGAYWVFKKNA